MQRVSFSLTALDLRMVDPVSLDSLNHPKWCKSSGIAKVPVVRLFGISRQGASVCAHVHGSWPFFYAELSEELAQQLTCTDTDGEIAQPAQLAAAIEDAVNQRRSRAVKVVNLQLERWRSVYGLHLALAPFLRVELMDPRDVELVAAALQQGDVPRLGTVQAHEAHLPFLLHFLSEHHLSGAGLVRVSGTERASRLSCCTLELDVMAPDGIVNWTEFRELLERCRGSEAKALAALRAQLCQGPKVPSSVPKNLATSPRPVPGARTPLALRAALQRWLRGGEAPLTEATAAFSAMAQEMATEWQRAQRAVQDIEDLAKGGSKLSKFREASPARYSNPADDPRGQGSKSEPQSARVPGDFKAEAAEAPIPPALAAPRSAPTEDVQWEDVAGFLSVEVLTVSSSKRTGLRLAGICYVLRPHGCLLGGRQLRPGDRRGAIVVADQLEQERWREQQPKMEISCVASEELLLEAFVQLVRGADPDVCLGWELRNRSWGLILGRAKALGRKDLRAALSRVPQDASTLLTYEPSSELRPGQGQDPRTYESEMVAPSELQLPGRMVLNVWRLLMHLTFGAKLRSFAPQEAARELLGRAFPKFSYQEMDEHWKGDSPTRLALLQHVAALAALSLEVADALEIFPRAGELSRLFGMDILSGFTRGTQLRVESLLMRVAHAGGFRLLSASQEQVRAQPALECLPLVMEPSSGFYWDPVLVLDFKGMYPSLIVAHNFSFDTCLGHSRRTGLGPSCKMGVRSEPWQLGAEAQALAELFDAGLEDEAVDPAVRLAASGALFVGPQVRKGLLPLMLAEVLQLRAETKRLAKTSSAALAKRLEHKQFALKYFANVTYGYSSASFSGRMPCSEIADAIVATGRRALEEAANFIEAHWEGAKVVYGDTDSVFVQLKGYSLEEAFQTGKEICAQVSAKHPAPVELEFEKVYMPCLCLTKKRYGGLAYAKPPSEGGAGNFEAKGLEAIRRDQCRMASNVQNEILNDFFRTKDLSSVKRIFIAHATAILKGGLDSRHSVADFSFFREARLGTYRAEAEDGGGATLPPQAAVARNRIAVEGESAAPEYGERVSFAVAVGDVGARLVDRCVPPANLSEAGSLKDCRLDRWWYVEKALLPCTSRILHSALVGLPPNLDVAAWLREVPRPSSSGSRAWTDGPLDRLLRASCQKCGEKAVLGTTCHACASAATRENLQQRAQQSRQAADMVRQKCATCAGALWRSCQSAEFCDVRTRRAELDHELAHLTAWVDELDLEKASTPPERGMDDWKTPETLIFDVDSGSEDEGPAPAPAVSRAEPSGGEDVAMISSEEEKIPATQLDEEAETEPGGPEPIAAGSPLRDPPMCKHQEVCREVEVKKEGANKGRHFFVCPRARDEQCDFFAWADGERSRRRAADGTGGPTTPNRRRKPADAAKSTPPKRRRTRWTMTAGRLERFVAAPSRRVRERIDRAKEHRLLLLSLKVVERGEISAAVVGHTGNVYDVRIGSRVLCTCLDFVKAKSACKHLLFLFLRVFQLPDDDPRLWQRALVAQELSDLRKRLEKVPELAAEVQAPEHVVKACQKAEVLREEAGQPCPVCFDPVTTLSTSCCCAGCGRNLHAECLEQWHESRADAKESASSRSGSLMDCLVLSGIRSTLSCPLCPAADATAERMLEARAASKAIPGQPLRRHVNLSTVSEMHAAPSSLEETYPETFKWIAKRNEARTLSPQGDAQMPQAN